MSKSAKNLVVFQQEELNAVLMYKALADKMKKPKDKETLLELASCEGKHAAILKKLTDKTLKPQSVLKHIVLCGYYTIGKKALFRIMAKSEKAAYKLYEPFFADFPSTEEIAKDELDHADKLMKMI